VVDGPAGLIRALGDALGPNGTLVMPSWPDGDGVFDSDSTPAAPDLGVVADTFWRGPGVARNVHPHAFAAAGPHAESILADPLPLPPHVPASPVGRVHDLDGWVLLLGVNHDADTTVHLAECIAEVPYGLAKTCTVVRDGRPERIEYLENDHCCARFRLVDDWLGAEGVQRVGPVGSAVARLVRSRDVVRVALRELRRDPLVFLHGPEDDCEECALARASVAPGPGAGR
jgi:aminoglycoside N3'-acetyltransferase